MFGAHGARSTIARNTILPVPFVSIFLNIVCASAELKLVHIGYQRPELMCNSNGDHGRPVGGESCFESRLDFLCCVGGDSDTTKCLGGRNDVESGQIKRGHIGSFLKHGKLLENGVLVVAGHNIDELEFLPSGCIQALHGILKRSIPDGSDDRASGSQLLLGNSNADRGRFSPSESATCKGVVRTGLVDWPVLGEISEMGSCLVYENGIRGPQLAQGGECLKGGQRTVRRHWE